MRQYSTLVAVVAVLLRELLLEQTYPLVETAVVETVGILRGRISPLLRERTDEVAVVVVEETWLVLRVRRVARVSLLCGFLRILRRRRILRQRV